MLVEMSRAIMMWMPSVSPFCQDVEVWGRASTVTTAAKQHRRRKKGRWIRRVRHEDGALRNTSVLASVRVPSCRRLNRKYHST